MLIANQPKGGFRWLRLRARNDLIQTQILLGTVKIEELGSRAPMASDTHINFGASAVLRKWPSLNNERRTEGPGPYLLVDDTLDECIREFLAKPASVRHLYEIHTSPQPPLVSAVLSGEIVLELARLREFL